jgi:hypothetical protein
MSSHRSARTVLIGLLALPGLLLGTAVPAAAAAGPTASPTASPSTSPAAVGATDCSPLPLQRHDFPASPEIDNRFLPLEPGMQFFLDGSVIAEDGTAHPHRIATTVTDLTKLVDGVRALVVFDVDIQDGQVVESELFFVAQREDGSVWTLGEYPEEFENGKFAGAPSTWISGQAGAHAGIAMLAHPRTGTPTYLQGVAPKIDFKDCATVFRTGQRTCVPVGCFNDVLVIDEFAPLDPEGGHQRKFYAPHVGVVRVAAAGGVDPEALQLTKAAQLCRHDLADIRQQVLAQDARGYRVAKRVYSATSPAKQTLRADHC